MPNNWVDMPTSLGTISVPTSYPALPLSIDISPVPIARKRELRTTRLGRPVRSGAVILSEGYHAGA